MTTYHFLIDSTYASDFIDFICDNYQEENHKFVVLTFLNERECVKNNKNIDKIDILYKNRQFIKYLLKIKKNDKLIIHGLFNKWVVYALYFKRRLLNCSTIVMWGADLYIHRTYLKSKRLKDKILDYMRGYIFKNVKTLGFDMPTDYQLMKEWYKVNRGAFFITYPQPINKELINLALKSKSNSSPVINILLGNSASRENNHIEAFEILTKYADENIKIYCPLSYGDTEDYRKMVIEKGASVFKDKFEPITTFMSSEEYAQFFSKMDVAIFNNNRQQAMGNITLAAFLGCKVYLRQNTTMWRQYVENGGCHFYPIETIKSIGIDEFKSIDYESIEINKKYFERLQDKDFMKKTWNPLLYQNNMQ